MTNYKTMICLISDQAAPNYTPLINIESVETVVLISSQYMKNKTTDFIETLKVNKAELKIIQIDIIEEANIGLLNDKLEKELHIVTNSDVLANITGGTKIMSITLTNWANRHNFDICYVHQNSMQIYNAKNNTQRDIELSTQLFLNEYLSMYGSYNKLSKRKSNGISVEETKFVDFLIDNYEHQNIQKLHKAFQSNSITFKDEDIFLNKLRELNVPEPRRVMTGRWLEIFIYNTLLEALGEEYVGFGYNLANRHQFPAHEKFDSSKHVYKDYDVVFLHYNTLHIIECKTSLKGGLVQGKSVVSDHFFKLNTITNIKDFGLFAKKFYITNYDISENLKTQAKVYDINFINLLDIINPTSLDVVKKKLLASLGVN